MVYPVVYGKEVQAVVEVNARSGAPLATDFKIGKVISQSLRVFLRNIVPFTALTCAASLPYVVFYLMMFVVSLEDEQTYMVLTMLLVVFLLSLAAAVIVHKSFHQMCGRRARAAEALSPAIWSALVFAGLVALRILDGTNEPPRWTVGILLLMALWCIAMPVYVVESTSPYQSLKRGIALTKGFRWKILALLVLYRGVDVLVDRALTNATQGTDNFWPQVLAETVWRGLSAGFGGVLIAVAYYSVRVAKEGVDVDRIGTVFD